MSRSLPADKAPSPALPEYELIRSRRRTISAEIGEGGRVIVRAPLRMPKRDIDFFVEDHAAWIAAHSAARAARDAAAERLVLNDDLVRALRDAGRAALPALAREWAARMGVSFTGITLTRAQHRWGSCSSRGRLSFSVRVMLLPEAEREYIVVHELAHLREMNHGPRFWALVARTLPDYRHREAAVRQFERTHVFVEAE